MGLMLQAMGGPGLKNLGSCHLYAIGLSQGMKTARLLSKQNNVSGFPAVRVTQEARALATENVLAPYILLRHSSE